MSYGGVKRDKRDILYSKIVRMSSGEPALCEYCRLEFTDIGDLDCAHIVSRVHKTTRWSLNPRGAISLCKKHHAQFTANPIDWMNWLHGYLGEDEISRINETVHCGKKLTKVDQEEVYQYLKDCYQELRERRLEGDTGIISFKEWVR